MGYDSFQTAEVLGTTVAYHETGSGEPLLMLHGGESHKGQYEIFAPHLGAGIRAISYDQRDTGDTVNNDDPYTMATLAAECVGLMDALGIPKAHVLGISFGGTIATHVGINHPDRVQSLIIGAAPYRMNGPLTPFAEKLIALAPAERESLMIHAVISPDGQRDDAVMVALRKAIRGRTTEPSSRRMAAVMAHDVTGTAQRITAPTLLVYGSEDPLAQVEYGTWLNAQIPGSELVVVPGARHGLSFEFRERTAALTRDWVLSHPVFA